MFAYELDQRSSRPISSGVPTGIPRASETACKVNGTAKSPTRSKSPRARACSASAAAHACRGGPSASERRASSVSTARCTRACLAPSTKMICFWMASLANVRRGLRRIPGTASAASETKRGSARTLRTGSCPVTTQHRAAGSKLTGLRSRSAS
jgi:hypothetical protein